MLKKAFLDVPSSVVALIASSATLLTAAITLTPLIGNQTLQYTVVGIIGLFALLGTIRQNMLHHDREYLQHLLRNTDVEEKLDKMTEAFHHADAEVTRLAQARLDAEDAVRQATYVNKREILKEIEREAAKTWEKALETRNNAWQDLEDVRKNLAQVTRIAAEVAERERMIVGLQEAQKQD